MSASMVQLQASPILDLPPEIRNTIYTFALVETDTICIFCHQSRRKDHGLSYSNSPFYRGPLGFLQSCRQIREEASGMYYSRNAFVFVNDMIRCRDTSDWLMVAEKRWVIELKKWLATLGRENLRSLQDVRVDPSQFWEMTMTLVRDFFDVWMMLQGTDIALEKKVMKMLLKVYKREPVRTGGRIPVQDDEEWISMPRIERGTVFVDVFWGNGSNTLKRNFENNWYRHLDDDSD